MRATLAGLAIAALIATSPVRAHAWTSGTDCPELADRIATLLDVKPGATVAEIGAGHGYMAVRMAEKVGPAGHVYATEIDPDELVEIPRRAADAGLANLTVVTASDTDTGLAPGCCDAIYMTDLSPLHGPDCHRQEHVNRAQGRWAVVHLGLLSDLAILILDYG